MRKVSHRMIGGRLLTMGVVAPGARSVERWFVPPRLMRPIPPILRFAPSSLEQSHQWLLTENIGPNR
jgi:hypothetical protein